ncbi:hypothetical protein PQ459_10295 [Chryseobacterium sp. KACC 21268]|nr:hypothetical protein PQ459_10295 [Chryseobacterium sp. KACC 21268]
MKNSILITLVLLLVSCNKFSKEESIVKNELSQLQDVDLNSIKFESNKTTAQRALSAYIKKIELDLPYYHQAADYDSEWSILREKDSILKAFNNDKKNDFTRVKAYALEGKDTTLNRVFYLNKDKVYVYINLPVAKY